MNCPHCNKSIIAWTGIQEAQKFQKHLNKCRKNPDNNLGDGLKTVHLGKRYNLMDAVEIRARSGQ